jgi:hypothetical protein
VSEHVSRWNHFRRNARISIKKKIRWVRAEMGATSTLPDEFDTARLFDIEVPDIKTRQFLQIVSPQVAIEEPVPMNDHT